MLGHAKIIRLSIIQGGKKKMRILVTGATGFIGRATVSYLMSRGHEVVALTTLSKMKDFQRVRDSLGDGVHVVVFDGNREDLRSQLELADAVVNLAGNI